MCTRRMIRNISLNAAVKSEIIIFTPTYLITICVCDLMRTLVQSTGSSSIIHIEMDPVVINVVLNIQDKEILV